jgi:hypothetical protein
LFVLVLVLVLGILAAAPIAAAPLHAAALRDLVAAPCASGVTYDPACDVNHDGVVNVLDVQITASHWNQTGTWLSDNSHNHLGQVWTGNSPLKIQGAFGAPDYAPLVLNNTAGVGLSIGASDSGVYIDTAGYNGIWVASAANHGLRVGTTGGNGVQVDLTEYAGVYVSRAGTDGVYVGSAANNGVVVDAAGVNGVYARGSIYAGYFSGNIYVTGTCLGCRQANFAINAGDLTLQPGEVVSIQDVVPTNFDTGPTLWQVALAQPGQAVVGVVAGRAEPFVEEEHRPNETGRTLVSREGAAQPGEYVTIVYSGPMQVKVAPGESAISAGSRLTAAEGGTVRSMQTRTVGGMIVTEGAPVIGIALEAPDKDGLVWVLVNPQ